MMTAPVNSATWRGVVAHLFAQFAQRDVARQRQTRRLKLEVLGMRLSYPAYRIELKLDENNRIMFTFFASANLAEGLRPGVRQ